MNKFCQFIINVRNFSYHWTVKQYDEEMAASEYQVKVMGFISGYVTTLIFIAFQLIFYFFGNQVLPVGKADPWWMKLLAGSVIFLLPVYLLGRLLLKKIEHK